MSRFAVFAVVLAAAVACAAAGAKPPVFSNSWSSDQIQAIQINQGGITQPDGSVCCPAQSPECKVQTAFQPAIVYNWFEGKKNAMKNPDGSGIVSDFTAMKEYQVTAAGDCQSYCPIPAGNTIGGGAFIFVNATNAGKVMYNGRSATKWTWAQKIPIFNVTMETSDFYVDDSGSSPVPLAEIDEITPFGQKIGQQNMTFVSFVPGVPDAKHFTVNNAAKCPQNSQCNSNSGGDDDGGNGRRLAAAGEGVQYRLERHMGSGFMRVVIDN